MMGCHINRTNATPGKQVCQVGNYKACPIDGHCDKVRAHSAKCFPGRTVSEALGGNNISRSEKRMREEIERHLATSGDDNVVLTNCGAPSRRQHAGEFRTKV